VPSKQRRFTVTSINWRGIILMGAAELEADQAMVFYPQ
jgi:hypothetical protein